MNLHNPCTLNAMCPQCLAVVVEVENSEYEIYREFYTEKMIYKEKIRIPSTEKVIEHKVATCINCDNEDIKVEEYEDQYGFISNATCSKCKKTVKDYTNAAGIITRWNNANDLERLLSLAEGQIQDARTRIKNLKVKMKERAKVYKKK